VTSSSGSDKAVIQLAHGGGGRMMNRLIQDVFAEAFRHPDYDNANDAALLPWQTPDMVMTTDSFVVNPLFFPGGDIGTLAVNGTVNDLAMRAARPRYLSVGFIIEEGCPVETVCRVAQSMRAAADAAEVVVVTGDTKVVERGHGHGLYVNTAGVGCIEHDLRLGPRHIRPGDAIVLSGDIGRHGIAVLASREELALETPIKSDCAPLAADVLGLVRAGLELHCLRDLTRGGLASGLVELSEASGLAFVLQEGAIAVNGAVEAACEVLGLSPLYVANEGRFVVFLPADQAGKAVDLLAQRNPGAQPSIIGEVVERREAVVIARSALGTERVIDMLSGDQLPRIC
jgi:hydrogenase expression/formation protein HypE